MIDPRLIGLFAVFAPLSLLSFGGGQAIVADVQHQTVDVHGWLSNQDFLDLFAVSRAAPGPSTLIAALIGYQVAGMAGALAGCIAIYLPSSLLVYGFANWWQRHRGSHVKNAIERGLAPVATGLVFAGIAAVLRAAHAGPLEIGTALACAALFYFTTLGAYRVMFAVLAVYAAIFLTIGPL